MVEKEEDDDDDDDVIDVGCVGVLGVGGGVIVTIEGDSATISATDFFRSVGGFRICSFNGSAVRLLFLER